MSGAIVLYLFCGVVVNLVVKGVQNSTYPFDDESLGIIVIWPLFVFKALLLAYVWVLRNIASSLGGAFKNLIGRK